MKNLLLGIGIMCALWVTVSNLPSNAQTAGGAKVVAVCGTLPQVYSVGSTRQLTVDVNGQVCQ